jgi:antitoxin (DNA-binding transcriptional repressor) of toxin-antitoxin stability system
MSETVMTVEDAAVRLADLFEQVHAQGEAAVIVKAGRPFVRIVPVPAASEPSEGLIPFLRRWRNEYPEPDEQLAEDLEESRQAVHPSRDPWDSFLAIAICKSP